MNWSEASLEQPACPVCGGAAAEKLYRFEPFQVVRCGACKFHFLSPRPTEMAMLKVYADPAYFGGESAGYVSYASQEKSLRATFRRLAGEMKKRGMTGGALLDVGCGYGYFLDEAKGLFSERSGTDFSDEAAEHARQFADHVYHGGVDAVPASLRFDCITALHVIEHVYDPRAFVRQLVDRLKPGGKLLLATPDYGSFWRPLMGRRWSSFKIPEHISYFDLSSLTSVMTGAGMTQVRSIPYPHAFPATLVASKLGLRLPSSMSKFNFWLPKTTVATHGIKPGN